MLAEISDKGETRLDFFLELEKDREVFYGKFDAYREFAEAYDCPLDRDGGTAGEHSQSKRCNAGRDVHCGQGIAVGERIGPYARKAVAKGH